MLIKKKTFLEKYPQFAKGMHVHGKDGEALGRVVDFDDESLTIERGVFFPKDFSIRYDDVSAIQGDKMYLNQSMRDLREWKDPSYTGWNHYESVKAGRIEPSPVESFRPRYESLAEETIKVPILEEELEARKVSRQAGEVRIRKIVHTELKHLTVPLSHEEVRIERVGLNRRPLSEKEANNAFREETISMPIMDEEVEVGKRTVVKEEVQLKKERRTEQRDVSEKVRSEDVEIQGADTEKKKKVG